MHILIPVLHRPTKPTGVCRHAGNLAQGLSEHDEINQVTLIVGEWQKSYFEEAFQISQHKVDLISVSIKNNSLSRNLWFLTGLPRLANQLQPDIVHLSFPLPFFRPSFKAPVVATIHDLYPYECPENFGFPKVLFNRWFLEQCVAQSDGLSCVSQGTLEGLKRYFPRIEQRKPATCIYNHVDFSSILAKVPKSLPFAPNAEFILCVAQHRKNKNLDLLIQSFAHLLKNGNLSPHTNLCLVGSSGPETETLLNLVASLELQNRVTMLSGLDDGELRWLYEHCLLFAIPSAMEGFCIPLVEAMSLSCRVVCSNIPIFREVGSSTCHYFDLTTNPVDQLSTAIKSALTHSKPDPSEVDPRFTKRHVTEQYLKFYRTVCESL